MAAMTRIKVCGLTRQEDIALCVSAGVHALGFVVEYPHEVPWNLDRKTAEKLMRAVPPFVSRVIVVGDDPHEVIVLSEFLRPHAVQLHGNESLSVTRDLASAIRERGMHVIKALRFSVETGRCLSTDENPIEAARKVEEAGVDAIVLDSVSEARAGGTGQVMDWKTAREIRCALNIPVLLAGGLNAGNVAEAIETVPPYGVDVISGVEHPVGKKDPGKLEAFAGAVFMFPTGVGMNRRDLPMSRQR